MTVTQPGQAAGVDAPAYAGFGRRLLAFIIDMLALWMVSTVCFAVAFVTFLFVKGVGFYIIASIVLTFGPWIWWWTLARTPGMGVMRYRLVDASTGGAPRFWRMLPRAAVLLLLYGDIVALSFLPYWTSASHRQGVAMLVAVAAVALLGFIAHLWMLWDPRRQTLIDKLSGVVTLRDRPATFAVPRPAPSAIDDHTLLSDW